MKSIKCGNCLGDTKDGVCIYCKSKLTEDQLSLYREGLELEKLFNDVIKDKIILGEVLSPEEDDALWFLIENDLLEDDDLNSIDAYIIGYPLLNKKIVSYELFELYFCKLIELSLRNTMKMFDERRARMYNPHVLIDDLSTETKGQLGYCVSDFGFVFDRTYMRELYNGNILMLSTIFHELRHGAQNMAIEFNIVTELLVTIIKDVILRIEDTEYSKNYYENNYKNLPMEIDAEEFGIEYCKELLDKMGLFIKNPEFFNWLRSNYGSDINNKKRIVTYYDKDTKTDETVETDLDTIFDMVISSRPELLRKYTQLQLEYVYDSGAVRRKTVSELQADLEGVSDSKTIEFIQGLIDKAKNL